MKIIKIISTLNRSRNDDFARPSLGEHSLIQPNTTHKAPILPNTIQLRDDAVVRFASRVRLPIEVRVDESEHRNRMAQMVSRVSLQLHQGVLEQLVHIVTALQNY